MNRLALLRHRAVRRAFAVALLAVLGLVLAAPAPVEAKGTKSFTFRVMTFNIRFDFPNDGKNRWQYRKELVAETITTSKASVVLLQEDKEEQIEDLVKLLPGWQFVGRGRNDNGTGERCAIAFETEAWRCVSNGDFWLSDNPDEPGSNTWGAKYPHKATWAVLEKRKEKGKVLFLSTHFLEGSREGEHRVKSARVVRDFLEKSAGKLPVVAGGDYNAGEDEDPHAIITDPAAKVRLVDVWDAVKPAEPRPGTNHGWDGVGQRKRIDWILFGAGITPRAAALHRHHDGDRWPSDHFPVYADLVVK